MEKVFFLPYLDVHSEMRLQDFIDSTGYISMGCKGEPGLEGDILIGSWWF